MPTSRTIESTFQSRVWLCVTYLMQASSRQVISCNGAPDSCLEASRDPHRKRLQAPTPAKVCNIQSAAWKYDKSYHRQLWIRIAYSWCNVQNSSRFGMSRGSASKRTAAAGTEGEAPDLAQKLLHLAWHPESNLIATAASNSLYMFCAAWVMTSVRPDVHILCERMF